MGHNVNCSYQPIPKRVAGVKRAVQVAVGEDHTIVLTTCSIPNLPLQDYIGSQPCKYSNGLKSKNGVQFSYLNSDGDREMHYDSDVESEVEESSAKSQVVTPPSIVTSNCLPTLKQCCERKLAMLVDAKTSPIFYALADTFAAHDLKKYCREFISRNFDAVLTQAKPHDLDLMIKDLNIKQILQNVELKMKDEFINLSLPNVQSGHCLTSVGSLSPNLTIPIACAVPQLSKKNYVKEKVDLF